MLSAGHDAVQRPDRGLEALRETDVSLAGSAPAHASVGTSTECVLRWIVR